MDQESKNDNSVKALGRGFEIVEELRKHESMTLTELADQLELPTSTAHVYLKTLEQEGFVICEDRQYRVALKFLKYGGYARQQYDIYNYSRGEMKELAAQTGERVGLGVEENGKRVLLNVEDGPAAVSDNIPLGESTEMHWTGLGKCLLAHLSENRRETIIRESDLPKATENTITDPDELRAELADIRDQGYAIEDEERREGIRGVDVPILTPDDKVLGAIGLSGPVNRFDAQQISVYVDQVAEKANVVELKTLYY